MSKITNRLAESFPNRISSAFSAKKNLIIKALSVALALIVWQAVSSFLDNGILLASPLTVIKRLAKLCAEKSFWCSLGFSFARIALGFFAGALVGALLAVLAGRSKIIELLLWPYMITIKSIPVASFVVIALVWISSANLSALISFLMVLPIIYTNLLEGIKRVDNKMLEMAFVFKMGRYRRLKYIWLPSVSACVFSGVKIALGLAWKSGVAAELIGVPNGSVGEMLYNAKLFLNTPDLFAWTLAIVVISVAFEKALLLLLKLVLKGGAGR